MLNFLLARCRWLLSSIKRPLLNARHMFPIPPSGEHVWETKLKQLAFLKRDPPDDALFVGVRPMTEWEFNHLADTHPYSGDGNAPIVNVSWYDAVSVCNMLSQHEGLAPCYEFQWKRKW